MLSGFLVCLVTVLGAWTWAIQRQFTYGQETPDLISVFFYVVFVSLVTIVAMGVKYIPLSFRTRARHLEYQNYLELEAQKDSYMIANHTSIDGM